MSSMAHWLDISAARASHAAPRHACLRRRFGVCSLAKHAPPRRAAR